jgi:hypothetical protein
VENNNNHKNDLKRLLESIKKTLLSPLNLLIHGKLDTDHLLRLAAYAALGLGVLDFFQILELLPHETISLATLGLLAALLLYSVAEKDKILQNTNAQKQLVQDLGTVQISTTEHDVFSSAIDYITHNKIDTIRIFAPVALWTDSSIKLKWIEELGQALEPPSDEPARVRELKVIYGLPPKKGMFQDVMVKSLNHLKGKEAALIRYIDPTVAHHAPIPGWGILIMGNDIVSFAFATHGYKTLIDSAIQVTKKDAVKMAIEWFDQAWEETRDLSLQDARQGKDMDTSIKEIEARYDYIESTLQSTNGKTHLSWVIGKVAYFFR